MREYLRAVGKITQLRYPPSQSQARAEQWWRCDNDHINGVRGVVQSVKSIDHLREGVWVSSQHGSRLSRH